MNMKTQEMVFHFQIITLTKCYLSSIIQNIFSLIKKENGTRWLTEEWQTISRGMLQNTNTKDYIIIFSENNIHNSANNKCGLCAHTFVYDQIVLHEQGYGIIYVNGKEQERKWRIKMKI